MTSRDHSIEAEQAVLGGMLLVPDSIPKVFSILDFSDFFDSRHRFLANRISKMSQDGETIDMLTVLESLESSGDAGHVGGAGYVASVVNNTPGAANIEPYSRIVRDKANQRKTKQVGRDLDSGKLDPTEAAQLLHNLSQSRKEDAGFISIRDNLGPYYKTLVDRHEGRGHGIQTGLPQLDGRWGGLRESNLIIIAGQQAAGKSAFAMQIGYNVGQSGSEISIFSQEMDHTECMDRFAANHCGISLSDLRKGKVFEGENSVNFGRLQTLDYPIEVDDATRYTIHDMENRLRARATPCGLVIIDHLHIVVRGKTYTRSDEQINEISRNAKRMAKDLKVPVILLAQLSNEGKKASFDQLDSHHIRGSAGVAEDADIITFICNTEFPDHKAFKTTKCRSGVVGTDWLKWDGPHQRFDTCHIKPESADEPRRAGGMS